MKEDNYILDTLYNCTDDCIQGNSTKKDYAKGVLVGLVSGLTTHEGETFNSVIELICSYIREHQSLETFRIDIIPTSWTDAFAKGGIL